MKKSLKLFVAFCLVTVLAIAGISATVQAAAQQGSSRNYGYQSTSDSYSFYASSSWKASYAGYPGMVTFTSSTQGSSGNNCVYFTINENKQTYDYDGAIVIQDSYSGSVLCYLNLRQAGKNKSQPSTPLATPKPTPVPTPRASSYITSGQTGKYSYKAQTDVVSFYADRAWKATFVGYPGMAYISSTASGTSGNHSVTIKLSENKMNSSIYGALLIQDANTGSVICYLDITQSGKNQ